MTIKICKHCRIEKKLDSFQFRKDTNKYRNICKDCTNARTRSRYNYSEKYLRQQENITFRENGNLRCCKCNKVKALSYFHKGGTTTCKECYKKFYHQNKKRILEKNRSNYYQNTYGITREALGTICEICEKENDLVIDHCHSSNKIRGLLCRQCNAGIGLLGDTLENLQLAVNYLKG